MKRSTGGSPGFLRWSCAAAACALLLMLGGCGGGGNGDGDGEPETARLAPHTRATEARLAYGRSLFRQLCAGCHTLADADANGQRYNLDNVALTGPQVWGTMIQGGPGMPAWRSLSKRELSALGLYLLDVARQQRGEDDWGRQINRRFAGGELQWLRVSQTITREVSREAR